MLDQACWYLNESSLHEESEYVLCSHYTDSWEALIYIYKYLALGRLRNLLVNLCVTTDLLTYRDNPNVCDYRLN